MTRNRLIPELRIFMFDSHILTTFLKVPDKTQHLRPQYVFEKPNFYKSTNIVRWSFKFHQKWFLKDRELFKAALP